jgi:hypothetical protein
MADPFAQYAVPDTASDPFAAYAVPEDTRAVVPSKGVNLGRAAYESLARFLPLGGATVGGTLGGVAGTAAAPGLGTATGAMLGGTAGYGVGDALKRLMLGESQQGPAVLPPALVQGALSATGETIAPPVMSGIGKLLMRGAVRPATEAVQRFPGLLDEILARGKPVGAGGATAAVAPAEAKVAAEQAAAGAKDAATAAASRSSIGAGLEGQKAALRGQLESTAETQRKAAMTTSQNLIRAADESGQVHTAAELASDALARAQRVNRGPLTPAQRLNTINMVKDWANEAINTQSYGALNKSRTVFTPSEVDLIRQQARDAIRGPIGQAQTGGWRPPVLATDIEKSSRNLLHDSIEGLRESRAAESQAMSLREAAGKNSTRILERLSRRGSTAAGGAIAARQALESGAAQNLSQVGSQPGALDALKATPSAAERNLLVTKAMSGAENRTFPGALRFGLSGLVGGEEYRRTRNPEEAALAALLTAGATTPQAMSRAALLARAPGAQMLGAQVPRGLAALLRLGQ